MNQKSRQNAKNAIKKDFFKLISNSNFGFDYRKISEINEISYIKNIIIQQQIANMKHDDPFRSAKINLIKKPE